MRIRNNKINNRKYPYLIAEIGLNHSGNLDKAIRMISECKKNGADAVKFQRYTHPSSLTVDKSLFNTLEKCQLTEQDFITLRSYALSVDIDFIVTPFDIQAIDFLDQIGVDAIKIGSGESDWYEFIYQCSKKRKPLIISMGNKDIMQISCIMNYIKCMIKNNYNEFGAYMQNNIAIMHCVSSYPCSSDVRMSMLGVLRNMNADGPIGYSDHSLDYDVLRTASALGADIIEVHVRCDSLKSSVDQCVSYRIDSIKSIKEIIKKVRDITGCISDGIAPNQSNSSRGAYYSKDIKSGDILDESSIEFKRPNNGIDINSIDRYYGKFATIRDVKKNQEFSLNDLSSINKPCGLLSTTATYKQLGE